MTPRDYILKFFEDIRDRIQTIENQLENVEALLDPTNQNNKSLADVIEHHYAEVFELDYQLHHLKGLEVPLDNSHREGQLTFGELVETLTGYRNTCQQELLHKPWSVCSTNPVYNLRRGHYANALIITINYCDAWINRAKKIKLESALTPGSVGTR